MKPRHLFLITSVALAALFSAGCGKSQETKDWEAASAAEARNEKYDTVIGKYKEFARTYSGSPKALEALDRARKLEEQKKREIDASVQGMLRKSPGESLR